MCVWLDTYPGSLFGTSLYNYVLNMTENDRDILMGKLPCYGEEIHIVYMYSIDMFVINLVVWSSEACFTFSVALFYMIGSNIKQIIPHKSTNILQL